MEKGRNTATAIFFIVTLPALVALASAIPATALGRPAAPVGLLVNGVSDPLAIDRDTTRFTWMSPG
ncbi:MAG: hypothetical protein ACREE6_08770, partial [Limisphaerales bacterium]